MKSAESEHSPRKIIVILTLITLPFLLVFIAVLLSMAPHERERFAIRAALVFIVIGVVTWLFARAAARTTRLIRDAAEGRTQLVDGARIAVIGTIEPESSPMLSPMRNAPCVAYGYSIYHFRKSQQGSDRVVDFFGSGMVSSFIASGIRRIKLLELPVLQHFTIEVGDSAAIDRARIRVADVPFSLTPRLFAPGREELTTGKSYANDARTSSRVFDAATMTVSESVVAPGHRVVAIGHYSAAESGLHKGVLLLNRSVEATGAPEKSARGWRIATISLFSLAAVLLIYGFWP